MEYLDFEFHLREDPDNIGQYFMMAHAKDENDVIIITRTWPKSLPPAKAFRRFADWRRETFKNIFPPAEEGGDTQLELPF